MVVSRATVEEMCGRRVLVVGDVVLDLFLSGTTTRLCREAPVPVVHVSDRRTVPGAGANAAVNLAALGAHVRVVGVIGDDDAGAQVRDALRVADVDDRLVGEPGRRTLRLTRVCAGDQLVARFDDGDDGPPAGSTVDALVESLAAAAADVDAILVSDYDKGTLGRAARDTLARLQRRAPRLLVLDAKHVAAYRTVGVTAVKPNWSEAVRLLGDDELAGDPHDRVARLVDRGEQILDLAGAQIAAVTLDSDGALVFERGRPPHRTYTRPERATRATGAGDTFVAAFTLALAAGAQTPEAAELASRAAEVVLERDGTTPCSWPELARRHDGAGGRPTSDEHLTAVVEGARRGGRTIVLTNGCFDVLHRGHVAFLNRARELGDVLVVGVNDDAGVRSLKGSDRPVNPLGDRVAVLGALSCVDAIVPFSGRDASDLIRRVRPDVYAKGGDYTRDALAEAPVVEALGGRVEILPYLEARSTTSVIERIRARHVS